MPERFANKPTTQAVDGFSRKIEELLAAHRLNFSMTLRDRPLRVESSVNGVVTDITSLWIDRATISTPEVTNLEVELFGQGIPEDITSATTWGEAMHIQDQLYRRLNRRPSLPPDNDDPYWKLWDKRV